MGAENGTTACDFITARGTYVSGVILDAENAAIVDTFWRQMAQGTYPHLPTDRHSWRQWFLDEPSLMAQAPLEVSDVTGKRYRLFSNRLHLQRTAAAKRIRIASLEEAFARMFPELPAQDPVA